MIDTIITKEEQLRNGWFEVGSGKVTILIVGSCRSVPYLNYLHRFNKIAQIFTIRFIDPFNWHWNARGEPVDYEAQINSLEGNDRIRKMLSSTDLYIHEYYQSFGMFNSSPDSPKNIYQFGMNPKLDITIPNFNDVHVLGQPPEIGLANLEKFYKICRKTSFPEMADYFRYMWREKRMFWSSNHVSRHFTLYIFRAMSEKYLKIHLPDQFWNDVEHEDLFANTPDPVSQQDIDNYQLKWTNH